ATQAGSQPSWGPLTFAVTAGTLPAGLSLSTAGVLSGTPTAAGTFTFAVTASNLAGFGTQQYSVIIQAASASISVSGYGVPYDGNAHTASGMATGVGGVDVSTDLTLAGTVHTNAGTYTDAWSFHDPSGNYQDASGTVSDSISPANAHPSVTGYSIPYDGNSH